MPRPKTKKELLNKGHENYTKLLAFIDAMSSKGQLKTFPKGTLNRNVRDVLAHLHHWNIMFLEWYKVGMSGEKPDMPAKGYTWKTTPALNVWINEKYASEDLPSVRKRLEKSYEAVRTVIEQHSEEELFEKKRYKWTGSTSMGSYLVSVSTSHYEWAYKLIRKATK